MRGKRDVERLPLARLGDGDVHSHEYVCKCGTGFASRYDGKCGHCRTRREREEHADAMLREFRAAFPDTTTVWVTK